MRNDSTRLCSTVELRTVVWREWQRALRTEHEFSLIFFEVAEGEKGDRKNWEELTRVLLRRLRMSDEAGWVHSKRMCVVLPFTSAEDARVLLDDIRKSMGQIGIPVATSIHCVSPPKDSAGHFDGDRPETVPDDFAPREPRWKRLMDTTGATIGLILAAPVMIMVAIAVKLTSSGPVLFRQRRIGYRGLPFNMYKFRSMSTDAPDTLHRRYVRSLIHGKAEKNGEGCFKLVNDPRLTSIGGFIRKWSLDELPQLFNVLKGDMSLVGPRPDPWYAKNEYRPWYYERALRAKPGITGLWQVEGRSRVSYENMVRMDIRYLNRLSFVNDFRIFLRTFRAVLSRSGAH